MAVDLGHNPLPHDTLRTIFENARGKGDDYLIRYSMFEDKSTAGGIRGALFLVDAIESFDETITTTRKNTFNTLVGIYEENKIFDVSGVFDLNKPFDDANCTDEFKKGAAYQDALRRVEFLKAMNEWKQQPFFVRLFTVPKFKPA